MDRVVTEVDLPWLDEIVRPKKPRRVPTVPCKSEVARMLAAMEGTPALMARMGLEEGVRLRVKDVDFERGEILVRVGKGAKDRVTMLPRRLEQPPRARATWEGDAANPCGLYESPSPGNRNFKRTGGVLLSADYTLVPSVTFAEPSGFALSTGLGGLFGRSSNKMDTSAQVQALGASTTLLLLDNASGAQIVAAQGSAKNYNLGAGVGVLGGLIAGVNAYANTPQGKIVAAAFLDAYNKLVIAARQYAPQKAQGAVGQGGKLKGP